MNRQVVSAVVVGVFAVLAVGSTDGDSSSGDGAAPKSSLAAAAPSTNTHFAHGAVNVRSGPGERFRIVRTLARGDTLSLGEPDARGWAPVRGTDSAYVFTRIGLVRTDRPVEVPDYADEGACAEDMRRVHQRMNRAPDEIKRFSQSGVEEVTWWYREHPRDAVPKYQYSFLSGPYDTDCRTSTIES
jgi:hypothetical protein